MEDNTSQKFKIDFEHLPVYTQRDKITQALQQHQVIVVESNTGSGKTTQLPVILYEAGYLKDGNIIGMTQPRRIATFSISAIVGEQLCFQYPELPKDFVRYKMRFEDCTTPNTQVKIMTDGTLLQEIKHDSLLSAYSVLVIDEVHERSLNIDFILGLLRNICQQRKDLKIIISSATINSQKFAEYFEGECPVISIEAPMYPVDLRYIPVPIPNKKSKPNKKGKRPGKKNTPPEYNREEAIEEHIVEIVKHSLEKKEGDILIFVPGERTIKNCLDKISQFPRAEERLHLLPLYGRLDHQAQEKVFFPTPEGKTKIIVATNIAETSITIDGITVVVDSGQAKLNYFNYQKLTSTLLTKTISKASAIQRRGRAGRTCPGICYRLYSEATYNEMDDFTQEEILRTDLSEIVLRMAHLGITDYENFKFISSPPKTALVSGIALLQDMEALNQNRNITDIGLSMIKFPLSPVHARIVVEAMKYYPDVLSQVLIIVAFLTTSNPYLLPMNEELAARAMHRKFIHKQSDFFSYIKLFEIYTNTPYEERPYFCDEHYLDLRVMNEIVNIHHQLSEMVAEQGVFVGTESHEEQIMKSILKGMVHNVCIQLKGSTYLSRSGEKIYIHPGSVMFDLDKHPKIVIAGEIVQTSKVFARSLSWCKLDWFKSSMPHLYGDLTYLFNLIKSKSYASRQKLRARMDSPYPLFSISPDSAFNNIAEEINKIKKSERDISMTIFLLGTTHNLKQREDDIQKYLPLTWQQVQEIEENVSVEELNRYAKLRCDIFYNVHAILRNVKFVNIPIMAVLYGEKLIFTPRILPSISMLGLKKNTSKEAIQIIDSAMHILIPSSTPKKATKKKKKKHDIKNEYRFLTLEINNAHEIFLLPEGSFIQALQDSLHTLGHISDIANELKLPKEIRMIVDRKYKELRHAYERGIVLDE